MPVAPCCQFADFGMVEHRLGPQDCVKPKALLLRRLIGRPNVCLEAAALSGASVLSGAEAASAAVAMRGLMP